MNNAVTCASPLVLLLAAGCSNPDTAIFATSTSFGINVERTPATVAVAYDRTEAFVAPRFANGGAPPAVAVMRTDGQVFNPEVKQLIATGRASELVTEPRSDSPPGESALEGGRKLMFFGTGTTIGIKAAFGTDGLPESAVFGYKRKELSIIPLGIETYGTKEKARYPSTLASIDTVSAYKSNDQTGLKLAQFIAIGKPAENLARNNEEVRAAFKVSAAEAAMSNLSAEQKKKAEALANTIITGTNTKAEEIMKVVAPGNALDPVKWASLVNATVFSVGTKNRLLSLTTAEDVALELGVSSTITDGLHTVLPQIQAKK